MHTFQIASLLVFALVYTRICWIYVIYFFKKIMYFVYISTYLGNMLVVGPEIRNPSPLHIKSPRPKPRSPTADNV